MCTLSTHEYMHSPPSKTTYQHSNSHPVFYTQTCMHIIIHSHSHTHPCWYTYMHVKFIHTCTIYITKLRSLFYMCVAFLGLCKIVHFHAFHLYLGIYNMFLNLCNHCHELCNRMMIRQVVGKIKRLCNIFRRYKHEYGIINKIFCRVCDALLLFDKKMIICIYSITFEK